MNGGMLGDLRLILGPDRQRGLRTYLAWATAYGVLSGVAMALIVPVIEDLVRHDLSRVGWHLLALGAAAAMACVAQYVQAMRGFDTALEVLGRMHERLGDHLAGLPLGWFTADTSSRITRAATDGSYMVAGLFAHLLTPLVVGLAAPGTVTVAAFFYDWRLGLAMLVCIPLLALAFGLAARNVSRGEQLDHAAAVEAGSRVVEFAQCQPVLRAFGRGVDGYAPLEDAIERQHRNGRRSLWYAVTGLATAGAAVQLAITLILVVGVWLALGGHIDPALACAVIALGFRFAGPLADVGEFAGALRMAGNDLRRLADVLREPGPPEPDASVELTCPGEITFDDVTFGYRPDEPVLRDVSFTVPPRSMTALVGASGSGKTTITRLIARFWDPDTGTVRVGGADVREQTTETLMGQLALVFQDVYLFDDTLEANIRLGNPAATHDEVRDAARLAGVEEIIDRLPDGWQTRVGEAGVMLSGGERQRVSVARAILKNAPVVLLDEATAALDPENERYVQQSLRRLAEHSTLLVIAHRLTTVVAADQVVVLDAGRVVETGTHTDLLDTGGRYAEFWRSRSEARGWGSSPATPRRDQHGCRRTHGLVRAYGHGPSPPTRPATDRRAGHRRRHRSQP